MSKITARINRVDWDLFEDIANLVGLRRDTYLSNVLPDEIDEIKRQSWTNDEKGRQYLVNLGRRLAEFGVPVTLRLQDKVIKRIDRVCSQKKIPRDALLASIIKYLNVRLLPHAIVMAMPRRSLKFKSESSLRNHFVKTFPAHTEILLDWKDTLEADYFQRELHFTAERIANMERIWQEFSLTVDRMKKTGPSKLNKGA